MTVFIGWILLSAGVALYILEPVFSGRGTPSYKGDDDPYDEAVHRRRVALTALHDLEYDRATEKVVGDDYERLKAELSQEALRHLGPAKPDDGPGVAERVNQELEEEIARIRRALREGLECTVCGHVNRSGARFCGDCGQGLPAARASAGGGIPTDGTDP